MHNSTFPRLPLVVPAKAGTHRNRHSHTNQGCQQPPPPRRFREGGNPAQPSLGYQPRSPTTTSPSSFPRRREPSATVIRIPTKVADNRLPLVVPAKAGTHRNRHSHTNQGCQQPPPPRRSREGGNPAQPSFAYQPRSPTTASPSSFPRRREPSATVTRIPTKVADNRLPLVVPAKAGTHRNRHSDTNQGCQQPPPPRRSRVSPSSFPRRREPSATVTRIPTKVANNHLPLVVPASPPRRSLEGGNPAQPSLGYQPRSPITTSPSSFPRRREPSVTVTRIPTKVADNHLPHVVPAKAGTQRNRHSDTNQGRRQPPPAVARSRVERPLHNSTFPRLPLVVPAKAGTHRNRHSHTNQGRQ